MTRVLVFLICLVGCSGEPLYETARDVTITVGEAWCDRTIVCGVYFEAERDQCESVFVGGACQAIACEARFSGDDDDVAACLDDLAVWSCTLVADILPPRCMGILVGS